MQSELSKILDFMLAEWLKEAEYEYSILHDATLDASCSYALCRGKEHWVKVWLRYNERGNIKCVFTLRNCASRIYDLGHVNNPEIKPNFIKLLKEHQEDRFGPQT